MVKEIGVGLIKEINMGIFKKLKKKNHELKSFKKISKVDIIHIENYLILVCLVTMLHFY